MDERSVKLNRLLEHKINDLSKTERMVHDYVIANPEQVIYSAIGQLSKLVNVGDATILRYVRKMGFDGFTTFKLELFRKFEETKDTTNLPYIEQITNNMISTINETKQRVDEKKVDQAAQRILDSKKVFVIGQGASNITAQDTFSRLIRIGVDAIFIQDAHLMFMYASILNKDSTLLCYTYSGETHEVIKAAEICKKNDVTIIGITNYASSAMTQLADLSLFTSGYEQNITGGVLSAKVSQIFISDILVTRCALLNQERAKEYIERTTQSVFY